MKRLIANPPSWAVSEWFNTKGEVTLEQLQGQVVVAWAFQMLCPGCVSHALPQMKQVHEMFAPLGVSVIGLHTVFEHHEANGPKQLKAFLYEYRVPFPVGIDAPSNVGEAIPQTMKLYQMQGTPTFLLYDRAGRLHRQAFGHIPDLQLGAEIMALAKDETLGDEKGVGAKEGPGCPIPQ